ncbi:MAG TPA: hypothetical protein VHJ00_05615, partial [Bradyrhizobium sp.]|nr:hypothetical protein [Bradyrhizobium sp.]
VPAACTSSIALNEKGRVNVTVWWLVRMVIERLQVSAQNACSRMCAKRPDHFVRSTRSHRAKVIDGDEIQSLHR